MTQANSPKDIISGTATLLDDFGGYTPLLFSRAQSTNALGHRF